MKHTRMKTENMTKAAQTLAIAVNDLRAALNDANEGNQLCAWMLLESTVCEAATLQRKIVRILEAVQ